MKFVSDSEQVFPHSTIDHKPDSKPFEYQENRLHYTGLESENSIVKEYQNAALCASKANEEGLADHLPYVTSDEDGWTARKLLRSMSLDDLSNDNEKNVRDLEAPDSHSFREMESFEESVFYMDKSVTECGVPELIVCYKESTYHVKDICIDEGVPSQDRILFENNVHEKGVCTFLPPEEDRKNKLMEVKRNSVVPLPYVLKSSAENGSNEDMANQCDSPQESNCDKDIVDLHDSKDLMLAEKVKDDGIEAEIESYQGSSGKAALANSALDCTAEETLRGTEEAILASSDLVSTSDELNDIRGEATLAHSTILSATGKTHNNSEEACLGSLDLVSASEESANISTIEKLSYHSKVETGSIMFDFDASASAARSKEVPLQNGNSEYIDTPGTSRLEDAPRQSVSSRVHSNLGESSFSASGPLSGLISSSGPIAYSGNISHRSDSSTTSTRSFAFPILQSEWNSSPVRMAKADRRHYRKHKCWRQVLFCCRF